MKKENSGDSKLILSDEHYNDENTEKEEKNKYRKPRNLMGRKKRLIVLISFLSLILVAGLTILIIKLASHEDLYDESLAFYFSSDLLTEEGAELVAYDTIDFTLCNYADSLRVSYQKIQSYEISLVCDSKNITKSSKIDAEADSLPARTRTTLPVSISIPEKYYNKPIEVTVKSYPYTKILKGTFTVHPKWGSEIKDEKGSVYTELVLWANEEVTLDLKWDSKKITADYTNPYIKAVLSGIAADEVPEKCSITLAAGTSTTLYFFKSDIQSDYSGGKSPIKISLNDASKNKSENKDTEENK